MIYALAAVLPIMREGGGGCVVYLSAAPDAPDPLYGMGQAAARVLLRELGCEFHEEGIRASEVALSDPHRPDATGRCAEAVRRALIMPEGENAGFSAHTI